MIDSIGLIAVDVKNYTKFNECFSLEYESELKKTLSFERMFRIPVWYAYKNEESSWLWISALKAVEVGVLTPSKKGKNNFLSIKILHFTEVSSNQDIGKLWEQRLPSFKNNHNSIDDKHTKKNS